MFEVGGVGSGFEGFVVGVGFWCGSLYGIVCLVDDGWLLVGEGDIINFVNGGNGCIVCIGG